MVLKEKIIINEADENSLILEPADCDGFTIGEIADGIVSSKIYVYYNEVGILIDTIRDNIVNK